MNLLISDTFGRILKVFGVLCFAVLFPVIVSAMTIEKTAIGTPWQAGGTGSYQINVTNTGGPIAPGTIIVVKDNGSFPSPPLNLTSIVAPSGWDCTSVQGQCSYTVGSTPIASGTSWSFTVNVGIDASYTGGVVQNCAELTLQQAGPPVKQGCGCASALIHPAQPSSGVVKTAIGPFPWQAGGTGSYNIVVTNTGGTISGGTLIVHDDGNFPSPPLTMTSIASGPDWDCTSVSGQCSYIGSYPIAAGASWTFTVNVGIDASYSGGTVNNCAELTLQAAGPPQLLGTGCASVDVSPNSSGFCTTAAECVGPVLMSCIANMCVPMICGSNQNGASCNDGNACTVNDTCSNQACIGTPLICDDGNTSTIDSCNPVLGCVFTPVAQAPSVSSLLSVQMKHSPRTFSTGAKGTLRIKVKNKGHKLGKGMLTVVNHMPAGLSVKTGSFRANSWRCKGGMVSSSGQDVTCTYNRELGKKSRATLNLNVRVRSAGKFPADVKEVENCATASVKDSSGMAINQSNRRIKTEISRNSHTPKRILSRGMVVKVCDKVKIRHMKSSGSFNLPIGIGIGMGGIGGGGAASKGAATRGVR